MTNQRPVWTELLMKRSYLHLVYEGLQHGRVDLCPKRVGGEHFYYFIHIPVSIQDETWPRGGMLINTLAQSEIWCLYWFSVQWFTSKTFRIKTNIISESVEWYGLRKAILFEYQSSFMFQVFCPTKNLWTSFLVIYPLLMWRVHKSYLHTVSKYCMAHYKNLFKLLICTENL